MVVQRNMDGLRGEAARPLRRLLRVKLTPAPPPRVLPSQNSQSEFNLYD
jgi:hypothetical protein